MLTHSALLPFLLNFSLICPPPQPPSWLWTDPSSIDLPRSFVVPASLARPSAWSPESSSMPSFLPFWAGRFDLPAALRRQLLSSYSREFPSARQWLRRLPDTRHHHRSSPDHHRRSTVTSRHTSTATRIIVEGVPMLVELAGSSQVTQLLLVIDYFPYFVNKSRRKEGGQTLFECSDGWSWR